MRMITSLSNASLQRYPSNTLTKFTHFLPSPVLLPPPKSFCIALRSLSLCCKLKKKSQEVGFIKIHLAELNPRTSPALGDDQCLARVPFLKCRTSQTFWYDITHPIPIQLTNCSSIQEFNFLITDEENNQLQLEDGPTTVLTLELTEMMYADQFSITCNPYDSIDYRETNSNIDFHTFLPRAMNLDSEWEVALHNVVIPKRTQIDDYFFVQFLHADTGWEQEVKWPIKKFYTPNMKYEFKRFLSEWGITIQFFSAYFTLRVSEYGKITFNEMLCRALGFTGKNGMGMSWDFNTNSPEEHCIPYQESLGDSIDHLAFYSDIVTNSFVGNSESPILDILSTARLGLLHKSSASLFYVPHLTFRSISKPCFSSIHFMIYTLDGKRIFIRDPDKKGISITLLFRRRNKNT